MVKVKPQLIYIRVTITITVYILYTVYHTISFVLIWGRLPVWIWFFCAGQGYICDDIFVSGFVCKLFSQESTDRFNHTSLEMMFTDKKYAPRQCFDWMEEGHSRQRIRTETSHRISQADRALPFLETSRYIRSHRPRLPGSGCAAACNDV